LASRGSEDQEEVPQTHPDAIWANTLLARVLMQQGKRVEAQPFLRDLAEQSKAQTLNQWAWEMATSDDPKLRDGPTAVMFAEKAVAATIRKNPQILDTLAAAYAEVGQFAKAVTVQQEAIALLQDEEQKKECTFRQAI